FELAPRRTRRCEPLGNWRLACVLGVRCYPLAAIVLERGARPAGIPAVRGAGRAEDCLPTREIVRAPPSIHSLYLFSLYLFWLRPGRSFSRSHGRGGDHSRQKPGSSYTYRLQSHLNASP